LFFVIHFIILASEAKDKSVLDCKMAEQTKQCQVCNESFEPDRRVGVRQKVCKKLSCQLERKRRNQVSWVHRNPGYFKGRYPNTKFWLKTHPGYLQAYRQRRSNEYRADIQDELTLEKSILVSGLRDIQDELTSSFEKHLPCGSNTDRHDIQVEITRLIPALYLAMIYKSRLRI